MFQIKLAGRTVGYPELTDGAQERAVCTFCGLITTALIIAASGEKGSSLGAEDSVRWLLCPDCGNGLVQNQVDGQMVTFPAGVNIRQIDGLPSDVEEAWRQAKVSFANGAFTGCELVCRNILMYVAVEKGAKKNRSFQQYVDHLTGSGYTTPAMQRWVDQIRQNGNKAAHELQLAPKSRAESTLRFTEQMLRIIYEMDSMAAAFT